MVLTSSTKDSARGSKSRPNQGRRVRIVGKIRPLLEKEIDGTSSIPRQLWISVLKPVGESPDHATIVFRDQEDTTSKESYKLDWCYEQDEDVGEIFLREVKPLLQGIYHGSYATVLAYGARGCGKTQLIKGSEEKPGLAPLTIAEIISPKENSTCSVTISFYEVYQDRVFDLLGDKEQEIHVLEDVSGRIQFKGLSQAPVESISNFWKLCFNECKQRKPPADDVSCRSHKGLIIYVSHIDKESNISIIGRMNFIDLAGYEDVKQKDKFGPHISKSARINKSLYALQNVIWALNANENHVPYRESKLTHLLRDSLSRESQAVMITCLKPIPCQDTIQAVNMASRACHPVNRLHHDSVKKSKSGPRLVPLQSLSSSRTLTLSSSTKKPGVPRFGSIEKKISTTPSVRKGRNLFAHKSRSVISMQGKSLPEVTMGAESFTPKKEKLLAVSTVTETSISEEEKLLAVSTVTKTSISEEETCVLEIPKSLEPSPEKLDVGDQDEQSYLTSTDVSTIAEGTPGDCALPSISERLREISNGLKLLSTQPLSIIPPHKDIYGAGQALRDPMEPKTPGVPFSLRVNDKWDIAETGTPQERFKTRSAGLKNSLVQECLTLLNSANKEELKNLKGIGEKRAAYILELRQETSEPFKELEDVKRIGLSSKQVTEMMTKALGKF